MTPSEEEIEELVRRAAEAAENAYAPYSGIRVGAAVLTDSGAVHMGVNVENASYGLTVCAERAALFAAVAAEGPAMRVRAIAVTASDPRVQSVCGACRQVLAEFGVDALVVLPSGDRCAVSDLLPHAFRLG